MRILFNRMTELMATVEFALQQKSLGKEISLEEGGLEDFFVVGEIDIQSLRQF